MPGFQHFRRLFLGVAAAALAAAAVDARPASAQSAATQSTPEGLTEPEAATKPAKVTPPSDANGDGEENSESLIPLGDPSLDPEEADPDDFERPRSGQRAAPVDGDLSIAEPALPVDGVADPAEPQPIVDGADATAIDMREKEDADLFENVEKPPAGYDPLLFQIEDIDPILSRKPEQLFKFEPYDPVGIKVGSFIYFPEAEANGAWFSNVFSSPKPENDVALELTSKSRLVSNWKVHALEFTATNKLSFYNEFDTENDKEYFLEARGRLDVTRRTKIEGSISRDHTQESRTAIDAATVGDRPDVNTDVAKLALIQRFNRVSVELRGSTSKEDISDVLNEFDVPQSNDDRDNREDEESVRAAYELKPSLALFTEAEFVQRDYKVAAFSDGISRDTDGQRYRVGLDFGDDSKILRGEVSFGYGVQDSKADEIETIDAFLFDSNVTWRINEITALRLTGRTDLTETTSVGSSGVITHRLGAEIRHEFRPYLIGTAGFDYNQDVFTGLDITDREYNTKVGIEYFANREIILFGDYEHTAFRSTEPDIDWDSDEVRVGVRIRR